MRPTLAGGPRGGSWSGSSPFASLRKRPGRTSVGSTALAGLCSGCRAWLAPGPLWNSAPESRCRGLSTAVRITGKKRPPVPLPEQGPNPSVSGVSPPPPRRPQRLRTGLSRLAPAFQCQPEGSGVPAAGFRRGDSAILSVPACAGGAQEGRGRGRLSPSPSRASVGRRNACAPRQLTSACLREALARLTSETAPGCRRG